MTAGRRGTGHPDALPVGPDQERQAIVYRQFRQDLAWWIGSNPRTALRVMRLVKEIVRDPFVGTGKPEALKQRVSGEWSRRITEADRLIYLVHGATIYLMTARWHYERH